MLFAVLGPLEVDTGAGRVVTAGGRPGALLACLLQSPRQVVPVHRLAENIWGAEHAAAVALARRVIAESLADRRLAMSPTG